MNMMLGCFHWLLKMGKLVLRKVSRLQSNHCEQYWVSEYFFHFIFQISRKKKFKTNQNLFCNYDIFQDFKNKNY